MLFKLPTLLLSLPRLVRSGSRLRSLFQPRNLLLTLSLAGIVALSGLLYWTRLNASQADLRLAEYQRTTETLKAALAAQERASQALRRTAQAERNARLAAEARAKESTDAVIQAIQADHDWASQPVPDAVADWVQHN